MTSNLNKPLENRTILFVNGSCGGRNGNTVRLMKRAECLLAKHAEIRWMHLAEEMCPQQIESELENASGIVFGTGTYWDSWGSPLQRFFEEFTHTEGTSCWLGKPIAVFVTMHSVGGKAVLSRLQGVLSTFGALIPPMSGLVYSTVANNVLTDSLGKPQEDLWSLDDVRVVCHNILEGVRGTNHWAAWPVDRSAIRESWLQEN